jgi:hypothetical protein
MKAGAMNVQLRVSAMLSNAPFIIKFDCDHYINYSKALRAALCFTLDPREGENTASYSFRNDLMVSSATTIVSSLTAPCSRSMVCKVHPTLALDACSVVSHSMALNHLVGD